MNAEEMHKIINENIEKIQEERQLMREDFKNVIDDIGLLYLSHYPKKGDSWRTMPFKDLLKKLKEEYDELYDACVSIFPEQQKERYKEAKDLILVALMLAERLRK